MPEWLIDLEAKQLHEDLLTGAINDWPVGVLLATIPQVKEALDASYVEAHGGNA